jgi:hypothetical protein
MKAVYFIKNLIGTDKIIKIQVCSNQEPGFNFHYRQDQPKFTAEESLLIFVHLPHKEIEIIQPGYPELFKRFLAVCIVIGAHHVTVSFK